MNAVQVHFINHFSGCQLCTQQNKDGDYGVCEAEYTKSFEYANKVFGKLLKRMPPRDINHQMQLANTPYCKVRHSAKAADVHISARPMPGALPLGPSSWPIDQAHALIPDQEWLPLVSTAHCNVGAQMRKRRACSSSCEPQ